MKQLRHKTLKLEGLNETSEQTLQRIDKDLMKCPSQLAIRSHSDLIHSHSCSDITNQACWFKVVVRNIVRPYVIADFQAENCVPIHRT